MRNQQLGHLARQELPRRHARRARQAPTAFRVVQFLQPHAIQQSGRHLQHARVRTRNQRRRSAHHADRGPAAVVAWLFAAAGILSTALIAQETRGTLFGRVLDPTGAPVAGATVTATNTDTNTNARLRTNETGYYEAALLLTGNYRLTVEMDGFKRTQRTGVYLPIRSRVQVDIALELGALTESVSVTAEAPLLETDSVSSGRVMANRELADLPMPINNPIFLTNLTPGVQTTGGTTQITNVANFIIKDQFTPGRVGGNEVLVDGVPNKTIDTRIAYLPQADTIQEFKVETSNFDASTGNTVGLNISMMTKSGTNELHGSASWQHWQQRWGGTPFFIREQRLTDINAAVARGDTARAASLRDSPALPSAHTNNYTATVGGPVILPRIYNGKDKLFFFVSYTGTKDRLTETGSINRTIPSLANREGDFSQLLRADAVRYQIYDPLSVRADPARPLNFIRTPIAGNILPKSRFANPAYESYLKFLPRPNAEPTDPRNEPLNNYVAVAMPWIMNYYAITNRVDYQYSGSHRFFGRWTSSDWDEDRFDWMYEVFPGLRGKQQNTRRNLGATLDWVWTASPATVVNVTGMFNGFRQGGLLPVPRQFKPSDVGLPKYLDEKAGAETILPNMTFDGYEALAGVSFPVRPWYRVFSGKVDVTHIRGAHSLRTGFDMRRYYSNGGGGGNTSGQFSFSNAFTRANDDTLTPAGSLGHSWAAFLMGLPSGLSINTADSFAIHSPTFSWYAHDNWRLTSKLTLSAGLRFEYEQGTTERYNRMIGWFDPARELPIARAAADAYARAPVPELPASAFVVRGGSVYPGSRGADRHLFQDQLMLLPRLAAAYQLNSKTVLRAGYGIYFDTLNILVESGGPNQFGFSRATNSIMTTDFGVNWLLGNPARGISPLTDPFPVRSDGTRFDPLVRDGLGEMAVAGRGFSFKPYDSNRARQQRWRVGVQRQFGAKVVVEAAYAGMYSDRVPISNTLQPLPERFWADGLSRNDAVATAMNSNVPNPFRLDNFSALRTGNPAVYQDMSTLAFYTSPTIRRSQLLRAYPHINGLTNTRVPLGSVRSHSLELSMQRRFSSGFSLNLGYTGLYIRERDYFHNEFDALPTERMSSDGRPHRFFAAGIWELPFGKGRALLKSGVGKVLAGGWQMAATYEYQPGALIGWGNLFYYGNTDEIPLGQPTLGRWFNTDNFERAAARAPAAFHRRVFPTVIDGVRAHSQNRWNANLQREFPLMERVRLQFRVDALNVFNRSGFGGPNTNPLSTLFGRVTSTQQSDKRWIQFQARVRF
ncbi:MAG: TonB-dependent receptor [Acidobacteria bacterium]|nr:TonB-dependent receptor [Acidobacteriota bacterium]